MRGEARGGFEWRTGDPKPAARDARIGRDAPDAESSLSRCDSTAGVDNWSLARPPLCSGGESGGRSVGERVEMAPSDDYATWLRTEYVPIRGGWMY